MADADKLLPPPPLDGEIQRGPKGRFVKGHMFGKGRPKGAKNRVITSVKQAMLEAGSKIGSDGHGRGGVAGFIERVGREDPSLLAQAIIRSTVPAAKDPEPGEGEPGMIGQVVILSI